MARRLLRFAFAIWIMSTGISGIAEDQVTAVRVLDKSEVEGLPGIVLLVNTGNAHQFQVFITDAHGMASMPHQDCSICTITALDPTELFFSKTTEFDGRSSSVTLVLEIRPNIDRIGYPGSIRTNIVAYGPNGELLPNHQVVIRPTAIMLDSNPDSTWIYSETTDSKGRVNCELLPGEYIISTIIGEKPWEATFHIAKSKIKCPARARHCIDPSFRALPPKQDIVAHLSAVSTTSQ